MGRIQVKVMDVLQDVMKEILPIPEAVRINFVFRALEGFPTLDEISSSAGISKEAAESVLSKYVHYGVTKICDGAHYEYMGLSDEYRKVFRGNPVRVECMERALKAAEDYLNQVEESLSGKEAEEVTLSRRVLNEMREEFLGSSC